MIMQWFVKLWQMVQGLAQNHPLVVSYVQLLGGKSALFLLFVLLAWLGAKLYKRPEQALFDINWSMGSVAEVFFMFLVFQMVSLYFKNPFMDSDDLEGIVSAWSIVEYIFLFVLLWFVVRFVHRKGLAYLGWRLPDPAADARVAYKGILFICLLALLTYFLYWTEILAPSIKIIHKMTLATLFSNGLFSVLQIVLVLLVSPVCEETFYRGFVYPVLRNSLPKGLAIVLVSLFFAAVHYQWHFMPLLFILSCALTQAYDTTRRLTASVLIHSFYNLLILFGFFSY